MRRIAVTLAFLFALSSSAHAQITDLNRIMQGGVEDAELLATRYMDPFGAAFGAALNSGWTHAARPHSFLGFHARVSVGVAMVPGSDRGFRVDQSELNHLRILNPEITESPTVSGGRAEDTYRFAFEPNGIPTGQQFTMPAGAGASLVPVPVIQAGVGLIRGTTVFARGIPSVDLGRYGNISAWGVGIQHGLNQYVPGGGLLPLHVSVFAGYNSLSMSSGFEEATREDQELEWGTDAWTFNVIGGRSFIFFSAYGGLGYETSSSDLRLRGTYTVPSPAGETTVQDPINVSLSGANDFKSFIGVRFNLAIIGVQAEYTLATYPSFNLAASVSLR